MNHSRGVFTLALALAAGLIAGCTSTDKPGSSAAAPKSALPAPAKPFANINADQFQELSHQPDTVILDVRTSGEYASGHIPGALNIDVTAPDFQQKVEELDKSRTYLVHCRSGARSTRACAELARLDFPRLYNLTGGMNAWQAAHKPVEK